MDVSGLAITLAETKGRLACGQAKANGSMRPDDCQGTQGYVPRLTVYVRGSLCLIKAHER